MMRNRNSKKKLSSLCGVKVYISQSALGEKRAAKDIMKSGWSVSRSSRNGEEKKKNKKQKMIEGSKQSGCVRDRVRVVERDSSSQQVRAWK